MVEDTAKRMHRARVLTSGLSQPRSALLNRWDKLDSEFLNGKRWTGSYPNTL